MSKRTTILIMILAIFFSCSDDNECMILEKVECTESIENLGDINLIEDSKVFMVYKGIENIIFKSENGDTATFVPFRGEKKISFIDKEFEIECTDGSMNQYTYIQEQHSVSHFCEDLNLRLSMNLYTYNSKQLPNFYDNYTITLLEPDPDGVHVKVIRIDLTVNNRGNDIEYPDIINCESKIEQKDNIEFVNKTFKDIFSIKQNESRTLNEMYYNTEFGLVGFTDQNKSKWVFNNFE